MARTIETSTIAFSGLVDRFCLTPELTEWADPNLGGPQRGDSIADTVVKYPHVAEWDTTQVREGENWVPCDPCELCMGGFQHPAVVEDRLDAALKWLADLPEVELSGQVPAFRVLRGEGRAVIT